MSLVLTPILFGVAFLVLWELFVVVRDVRPFLLPKPSAIWRELIDNRSQELEVSAVTGLNALVGLVCGVGAGVAIAAVASRFTMIGELLTPLAVAVSTIPIVVLVAVFSNMFATTSEIPRRLMVTIVVFFVVFVNVARGLAQTTSIQRELMDSYAAPQWAFLRKVRVPSAVPFFFTALKVVAPLAVVTAFVAEYFGGLQNGLGNRITSSISTSKHTAGWAYVACACALGLVFYFVASALERLAVPWHAAREHAT